MNSTRQQSSFKAAPTYTPATSRLLQRKWARGGDAREGGEGERNKANDRSRNLWATSHGKQPNVPGVVEEVLRSPGTEMDAASRDFFEPRFGHDFSQVRLHTDASAATSARAVDAAAFTVGQHVVFDANRYDAGSRDGRQLLGHELAHVVQQHGGTGGIAADNPQLESQADRAAFSATSGAPIPRLSATGSAVQRRISVRDVGRSEQSGMARLDEFVARLNAVSTGLDFRVEGGWLEAEPRVGGTLNEFDRQMQAIIADAADIPMRMTNRHGLLGDRTAGYHWGIELDTWQSGYVDVDDMLDSSPSGFMTSLVHLLRERQQTSNYKRRIGTASLDARQPGPAAEFGRVHGAGLDAELAILRDFLQDPSLRFINRDTRLLRNDRGDRIRERLSSGAGGINSSHWVVVLQGSHRQITLEEYRDLLEQERTADQVRRERLNGAADYRGLGGGVPAP